jgi:hypothetical protein
VTIYRPPRSSHELMQVIARGPRQTRVNEHLVLMPFQITIESIEEHEGQLDVHTIVRDVGGYNPGEPKEVRFGARLPWRGMPPELARLDLADGPAETVRRSQRIFQELVSIVSHEIAECLRYTTGEHVREPHPELLSQTGGRRG